MSPAMESPVGVAPDPRDVLDALQLAGVYEPAPFAAPPPVWDRPERRLSRWRSGAVLITMTALAVGAGIGSYFYVRDQRAKNHEVAETILAKVEADLRGGRAAALGPAEQELKRAFELESRSPRAALTWLRERALVGLLKGGADIAFEDAMNRAKEVGVPEQDYAFAKVASFLFQGDTAGAAGVLPKYDAAAAKDAWYQLLAGATLERAGDPRAVQRYESAIQLDPELVVAQIALARATAMDGSPTKAAELAKELRTKMQDRPEGAALVALAWARDPMRAEAEPPEVEEAIQHAGDLPVSLAFVPHALLAKRAIDKHDYATAKAEIQKGLGLADGPGVAAWLGSVALATGDEQLARKGALAAVGFSAVYPPARVLAARVALLGDRLDEALKATEELDPASPDVAVVRAAIAYERTDLTMLSGALEATPAEARKLPFLVPLAMAPQVLAGKLAIQHDKLLALAEGDAPWGDLVAMDAALDAGDLATADRIAAGWNINPAELGNISPLRALRASRLARYHERLDQAEALSAAALEQGTVTVRAIAERVFVLVARGRGQEVGPLLARYPMVLGPMAGWLNAYALASANHVEEARARTATLEVPPPSTALPLRIAVAAALGAMKDRRRGVDCVKTLVAGGARDPDVAAAAVALGFKKVERAGKRPTFIAP